MSRQAKATIVLDAADADGICASQTPAAGGEQLLTIDGAFASGGVATLDVERKILITSAADDSARTFTITGTTFFGHVITFTVAGPNTASVSFENLKIITEVKVDANTAGAITVGTNEEASSAWIVGDINRNPFNGTFEVQYPTGAVATVDLEFTNREHPDFQNVTAQEVQSVSSGITTAANGLIASPASGLRITTTAYTSGTITLSFTQAGMES